jgi:hypothetical protein
MSVPALPAMALRGVTNTTTGTRLLRITSTMSSIRLICPPGVLSFRMTSAIPSRSARATPFWM